MNSIEETILEEHGTLIAFGQKVNECLKSQCERLSQLLDQRDTLISQFDQTVKQLEQETRTCRAEDKNCLPPESLSGDDVQAIVEAQPGTVVIYPFVSEDELWLLWRTKEGIFNSKNVPVGRQQLGETVLKFRQLLETPSSNLATLQATSKQLYDWLIEPLADELDANQIQNLVFALDRVTRYIPMSALFDGENYLVENYTVSTILSADYTDTTASQSTPIEEKPVLALGLSNAHAGFNPLPNVPKELDAIVVRDNTDSLGIYPGSEFLNEDFDYKTLRDNLYYHKYLHIATHGEFVPGDAEQSYLLLGTGDKLPIPHIKQLKSLLSDIELVVLSACQTALGGPGQDGNEINGISSYFLQNGARVVAASLWLVNDASTSLLMQNFYTELARGTEEQPMTKAQALRQAQLSLLRGDTVSQSEGDERTVAGVESRPGAETASANPPAPGFSHPYYWAPFILIGNGL